MSAVLELAKDYRYDIGIAGHAILDQFVDVFTQLLIGFSRMRNRFLVFRQQERIGVSLSTSLRPDLHSDVVLLGQSDRRCNRLLIVAMVPAG